MIKIKSAKQFELKKNKSFVCALCHTPRKMKFQRNLTTFNYIQLAFICLVASYFFYPVFGLKVLGVNFLIWTIVEFTNKLMYRKELPCNLCGFDALWYRRDPKIARKRVEDFIERSKIKTNINNSNNHDHLEHTSSAE